MTSYVLDFISIKLTILYYNYLNLDIYWKIIELFKVKLSNKSYLKLFVNNY